MKSLLIQIRWQFLILAKNNLITIIAIVTGVYAVIFYLIKDVSSAEKFLVLLIYNDPAIIGLFFFGLAVIMEKNDLVLAALFVTPINPHIYLLSKIITLSIIGWACACGMAAFIGNDISWIHFSAGVFGTCVIFSLAGVFVVSYTTEFLVFMLKSIPLLLLLSVPLLNYFELTDIQFFDYMPIQGPLTLIVSALEGTSEGLLFSYISMSIWIPLLYLGVYRTFRKKIILSDE